MKRSLFTFCLVTTLTLPVAVFAVDHTMAGMSHNMPGTDQSMPGMNHNMQGMVQIGEQSVDGVKAVVYLNDVKATMAKMGMKETHHLMIHFYAADGKALTTGTTAVKIKGPDGSEVPALKMMGMEGHFGADVVITQKGSYLFTIGTQLSDGVKRQFELKYENK